VAQRNLAACFQYVSLQPPSRHLLYMLVKACAARADYAAARDAFAMHDSAGLTPDSFAYCALISAAVRALINPARVAGPFLSCDVATKLLDGSPGSASPRHIALTTCTGLAVQGKAGLLAQSHEVFEEARRQGISTTFLYNNLIDACARCKALEEALEVFKSVRPLSARAAAAAAAVSHGRSIPSCLCD